MTIGDDAVKHYNRDNFLLTQSIGFHLNKARNCLLMEMDCALRPLDINGQQMGILMTLMRGSASTPFEISKMLGIDSGLMTRMLDKLEEKGLLARSRSIDDRRVVNLVLTEKGKSVAEQIPEIAPEVLNERLKSFSENEFAEFGRLLQKFATRHQ
nr:MarR family transcriptional regulator [Cupriavidus plantarum]